MHATRPKLLLLIVARALAGCGGGDDPPPYVAPPLRGELGRGTSTSRCLSPEDGACWDPKNTSLDEPQTPHAVALHAAFGLTFPGARTEVASGDFVSTTEGGFVPVRSG